VVNARSELRKQAETLLTARDEVTSDLTTEGFRELIHELRTHQIELEMQNEELRRSEQELAVARDRFAELYDFAPVGYLTISDKGFILQANLTLAGLLGVERCRLIKQPFSSFVAFEDQDIYYRQRKAVMNTSQRQSADLRLNNMDSGPFWAHLEATAVKQTGSANDEGLLMAVSDITERKLAERDLMDSNAELEATSHLLENIIASVPIRVFWKDRDSRFLGGNTLFARDAGFSTPEALIGKIDDEMDWKDQAAVYRADDQAIMASGSPRLAYEESQSDPDGKTIWLRRSKVPLRDRDHKVIGILGIYEDITERKQTEKARDTLLKENRTLMRRLMQVQEEERRLLARDLHDELGQLLTSIDARAEYIARHAESADLVAVAEEIVRDTRASFDASHATLLRLRPGSLDLLGLSAALRELADQWQRKVGISCSLQTDGEIDQLSDMQTIAIYRLVQEGLNNAHRHGKADRLDVVVRSIPKHQGGTGQVLVDIRDNGKGMHVPDHSRGMGIIGMRERVHALGGTFLLTHIPHDGVRIEAMLPLDEDQL